MSILVVTYLFLSEHFDPNLTRTNNDLKSFGSDRNVTRTKVVHNTLRSVNLDLHRLFLYLRGYSKVATFLHSGKQMWCSRLRASGLWRSRGEITLCPVWMAPFLQVQFSVWHFVRSSLVFGLLARRTWPLALPLSDASIACRAVDGFHQPSPFRTSNSKRSGQSSGCLGFWADKVPSLHWFCKLLLFRWSIKRFSLCRVHSLSAQPRSYGRFCWPWQRQLPCLACVTGCQRTMDQTFPVSP